MSDIQEPSNTNKPVFDEKLADKILIELDGWQLADPEDIKSSDDEEVFINPEDKKELKNVDNNCKVSIEEVEYFYDSAFEDALSYTNRSDIDDLNSLLVDIFMKAVYKLAASDMFNKRNLEIRENEQIESKPGVSTYRDQRGNKLYARSREILSKFIVSELVGLHSLE